jgi:hypothetical protein
MRCAAEQQQGCDDHQRTHAGDLTIIRGTATITDGDTIRFWPVFVRLEGIDQAGQQCTSADGHTPWPLRILAALDGHFGAEYCSRADARPLARELKRHIVRFQDASTWRGLSSIARRRSQESR